MVSRYWLLLEASGGVGTTAFGKVRGGRGWRRGAGGRDGKEITRRDECKRRDVCSRREKKLKTDMVNARKCIRGQ